MAAVSIANIVKSSLGPVGLDKMLVDEVGVSYMYCSSVFKFFITYTTCLNVVYV